ncbi:leucine rich repeat protein, putative [Pediculus humanus corporis]|uniref:Leucine rich repeat protein, putative n=1 Tax=Pediculus humanus subsp. corporis TaxID=121224 RepID=E0VHG0_PEDHC|nr:leucine rich repeat protein, putative [Pediculus humanus corporis]EEB12816.1 leucine rich repeat protein, putative [Pediculus humanus corporis]
MERIDFISHDINKFEIRLKPIQIQISSLADVQYCKNLKELYVRKNEIKNLNEICYLKNLPYLKALWLAENPCSASDSLYRFTVIKNLPTLEKLDDVKIELEERQDSMKKGRDLIHPEDSDYENNSPAQSPVRISRSPPVSGRSSDQDIEEEVESRKSYSPEPEPPTYTTQNESKYSGRNDRYENKNYKNNRRPNEVSYEQQYDNGVGSESVVSEKHIDTSHCTSYLNRRNSDTSISFKKEKTIIESNTRILHNSTNQEDYEGDNTPDNKEGYCYCASNRYDRRIQVNASRYRDRGEGTRCSSSDGSGRTSPHKGQERAYRQYDNYRIDGERYSKPSPYPPRRPVTRNSNLLSAVLCLIKELDYPSLEVVAIAVRCRMDEFDD